MKAPPSFEFDHVSASQLEKFKRCRRLWFFQYPLGRKPDINDAMQYGIKVHDDLETYINGKSPLHTDEAKEIWDRGLIPESESITELSFSTPIVDDINLKGRIDLVHVDEQNRPVITDWKCRFSIGDETSLSLKNDLQLLCYAWAFPDLTELQFDRSSFVLRLVETLKIHRGGPAVKETKVEVSRDHVESYINDNIRGTVRQMSYVAEQGLPEVKPAEDDDECFRYGPCFHKDHCWEIPYEPAQGEDGRIATIDEESSMNLADAVESEYGSSDDESESTSNDEPGELSDGSSSGVDPHLNDGSSDEETRVQPPDAEPDRQPDGLEQRIEEYNWQQISYVGEIAEENLVNQTTSEGYETLQDLEEDAYDYTSVDKIGTKAAGNIREALRDEPPYDPDESASVRDLQNVIEEARSLLPSGYSWDSDQIDESDVREADDASDLVATMQHRLDKEQMDAVPTDDEQQTHGDPLNDKDDDNDSPAGELTEMTSDDEKEPDGDDLMILCINCEPLHVDGTYHRLYELLEPLKEELADELDVSHWNAKDFAKGEKQLGRKVLEHIGRFDGKHIVCADDRYPGNKNALEYLLPRADKVYKG